MTGSYRNLTPVPTVFCSSREAAIAFSHGRKPVVCDTIKALWSPGGAALATPIRTSRFARRVSSIDFSESAGIVH